MMPRTMRDLRPVLSLPILLAFASCGGIRHGEPYEDYRAREAAMMKPWEDLKAQKAALWELGFEPQTFEFEGDGTVEISDWQLTGWPDEVFVNARVRYVNTTDRPVIHAIVWLEVLDSEGQVTGTTGVRLRNPMGQPMWPGSSHTLTVRAPTHGAHLDESGWSWGVACSALEDPDPGAKPVLVVTRELAGQGLSPNGPARGYSNRRPVDYSGSYHRVQSNALRAPTKSPRHTPGLDYWNSDAYWKR